MPSSWLKADETLEIRHTSAAELFLTQLGLCDKLTEVEPDSGIAFVVELQHPTHLIVGSHFDATPEEQENYGVICFPKSKFTLDDVRIYLELLKKNAADREQSMSEA